MGLTALATQSELDSRCSDSIIFKLERVVRRLALQWIKLLAHENLKLIADATGLTQDQVGSIATSAVDEWN
jgi:hypothetical protein